MSFDLAVIVDALPFLAQGLGLSLLLTVLAAVGGIVLAVVLALMRLSGFRALRIVSAAYVNFFRSMPLILVIFWFFFLVPLIIGRPVGGFYSALIAFTLFEAAYYSEIVRAGIQSVSRGQVAAAYATGMRYGATMRFVVLPQAFRRMVPAFVNEGITLIKDSSLVSAIGLAELALAARTVAGAYARYWEPYLAISAMYLILTLTLSLLAKRLEAPEHLRGR